MKKKMRKHQKVVETVLAMMMDQAGIRTQMKRRKNRMGTRRRNLMATVMKTKRNQMAMEKKKEAMQLRKRVMVAIKVVK